MTDDDPADHPFDGGMSAARSAFLGTAEASVRQKVPRSERVGGPDTERGAGRIRNLPNYLADPAVYEEGREPTHATAAIPFDTAERAVAANEPFTDLEARFAHSPFVELLNGTWNFRFFERPVDVPATVDVPEANGGEDDREQWKPITVPRPWQTEGYDERVYANWRPSWFGYDEGLEWDLYPDDDGRVDVPGVGDDGPNPVGIYHRSISIPQSWAGRRIFVHFEGIKQAAFLWLDDAYLGFHQGSMTPAEFDLTDRVAPGAEHDLVVQVYRWSDAEALECFDAHNYSGIYRSVYLYSTPTVHLRDFHVQPNLDDDYEDATLRVEGELVDYAARDEVVNDLDENAETVDEEYTLCATLYDPDLGTDPDRLDEARVATFEGTTTVADAGGVVELETAVDSPETWSAERPALYTLLLEVFPEGADEPTETFLEVVGFRTFEATRGPDGHVTINGQPVDFRGTNRHEADPDSGRTVPLDTLKRDFELLKRFNCNAVRTSHYPNDPTFYRLADEYGIYVMDEVNVETHWWEGVLSGTTAFHDQAVARFQRMLLRDRNHPCVFCWSTGNEAGTAAEHLHMAALARGGDDPHLPPDTSGATRLSGEPVESFDASGIEALAPDRLLYHQPNRGGWDIEYADVLGPRYVYVQTLLELAAGEDVSDAERFGDEHCSDDGSPGDGQRSVVLGEYNHAMGSSLGLVDEIWNEYVQPPVRTARDTGGAHDGVLVGSPRVVAGDDDSGAVVLEAGDLIEVEESIEGDLAFETPGFALAVRFAALPDGSATLLGKGESGYALSVTPEHVELRVPSADGEPATLAVVREGLDLDGGDTHTLTGVVDADRLRLCLDGSEIGSAEHDLTALASSDEWVTVGPIVGEGSSTVERADSITVESVRIYTDPECETPLLAYDFDDLLRDRSLQGGFIWDWVNQDLNDVTDDGTPSQFYAVGGDGPPGEFSCNGMVWSDRRPQPELWQLKQCHQPVKVADRDVLTGEVYVTNHHQFTNLRALDAAWQLEADDEVLTSGSLDLDVPPGATEIVTIDDLELPDEPRPGVEYRLTCSFTLPADTTWADAGHEVAFAQLDVPLSAPAVVVDPAAFPSVSVEATSATSDREGDGELVVSGEGFEYRFDEEQGTFTSMVVEGRELLVDGPRFDCYRVPVVNERQDWGTNAAASWEELGLDELRYEVDEVRVDGGDSGDGVDRGDSPGSADGDPTEHVTIETTGRCLGSTDGRPAGFETTIRYRIYGSGDVVVDVDATPTDRLVEEHDGWLGRVGLRLEVDDALDRFEWYGRGPQETYPDRKTGVRIGRYEGSVLAQYVPYLPPSGNGNKAETRWATLSDGTVGLAAFADGEMDVCFDQWANLGEVDYQHELEPRGSTGLHLDHAVSGVGGTPIPPRGSCQVKAEPVAFSVRLRPIRSEEDPMDLWRQRYEG